MKYKILFSILGMILLLGSAIAGGIILAERDAKLTTEQTTALKDKGINDFETTKLNCNEEYCTFWVSKENVINSERRIEKYKEVCDEKTKICSQVEKTDVELLNERTAIVDNTIKGIANTIIIDNGKTDAKEDIGTDEKIIIGVKPK